MSDHIVLTYSENGFHISYMKPKYVTVQKHAVNESFLLTIPNSIAKAIPITKGDTIRASLDDTKRIILEKI